MSVVTNVILKTAVFEGKGVATLNEIMGYAFKSCDDPSLPRDWYAGSKALECEIYPAAFNYLDLGALVANIQEVSWRSPAAVQLFIQEQEDNRFTEVPLELTYRTKDNVHFPEIRRLKKQIDQGE